MSAPSWLMLHAILEEQRRRFDFRRPRVCRACRGRGERHKVLWWRGWRECPACHGRGMLGG
jgi:DnaJ-class molecular chaperone